MSARAINAAVWLYLWLSQILMPVTAPGDFWAQKAAQLVQFGPFDDMPRLVGRGIIPFLFWLLIDFGVRRRQKKRTAAGMVAR